MKSKLTQPLFMTAFVELVAPSCRRRRQGAKAHGRNPALICSLNGWPTAVHLKGPGTMAVGLPLAWVPRDDCGAM
jgi:hypothetical protein